MSDRIHPHAAVRTPGIIEGATRLIQSCTLPVATPLSSWNSPCGWTTKPDGDDSVIAITNPAMHAQGGR